MSETKQRAEAGWKVVGSKGKFIGKVEHVREDHLIVAQGRFITHTLYIPVDHIAESADGVVKLTLPATDADAQGWRFPPNAGFTHDAGSFWDSPVETSIRASGSGASRPGFESGLTDNKIDPEQLEDQSAGADETFAIPPDEKG